MNIRDIPQEVLERLQTVNSAATWQAPEAIKRELPKVTPLREAMLPPTLTPWLVDIAERMQCPLDYVAVAALVATSSVVGTGCAVRPKAYDDWTVVPNLWGGVIGEPGALKTPALMEAMRPLIELEDKAMTQYEADRSQYLTEMMMYKLTQEQLKKQMAALAKQQVRSGIQPGKLEEYLTGAIGGYENDGLMQRLQLLVYQRTRVLSAMQACAYERSFDRLAGWGSARSSATITRVSSVRCADTGGSIASSFSATGNRLTGLRSTAASDARPCSPTLTDSRRALRAETVTSDPRAIVETIAHSAF